MCNEWRGNFDRRVSKVQIQREREREKERERQRETEREAVCGSTGAKVGTDKSQLLNEKERE